MISLPPHPAATARIRTKTPTRRTLALHRSPPRKAGFQFILLLPPPVPFALPHLPPPALRADTRTATERDEQELVAAVNDARTAQGLGALTPDPLLSETARAHSREMCDLGYFDHRSPTPGLETPLNRYLLARSEQGEGRPRSAAVGENILYCGQSGDPYDMAWVQARFMGSAGHRANILDPDFTSIGVGLYRDDQGRYWVTEMFLCDGE